MSKFIMALSGMLTVVLLLAFPGVKVSADDNNTIFNAVEFTSETPAEDVLESDSDVDWFKYTVNSSGTISFIFTNLTGEDGKWVVTLFDENGQKQIWEESTSLSATTTASPLFSFENGTVLTLRIRNNHLSEGKRYQISAKIDDKGNWADEDNDNYIKASVLTDKEPLLGIINYDSDTDWYKYTVGGTNPFKITLDNMSGDSCRWNFSVYDSDGSTLLYDTTTNLSAASTASVNLMYEKGHELYIKINNHYQASNKIYQIKVVADSSTGWAKEDNGAREKAYKISSADDVKEFLGPNEDVDWYVYTAKKNEKVIFNFSNLDSDNGRWNLKFFEADTEKPVNEKTIASNEFAYQYELDAKKGNKYYICISNSYNAYDKVYKLNVKDSVESTSKDTEESGSENQGIAKPYSVLAGTNIVVGKADPGAKVSVKYGKKTYTATADSEGIYRVKTATLKKGKKITIWQTVDKKSSEKVTVKVVDKY